VCVITLNVNGIRSAASKGAFAWLRTQDADVDLPGYHRYFHDAQRKGYSGVALYSRRKPEAFLPHLRSLRRKRREYLICGDWNIAHKPIDLRNWQCNQKNSGFLPEERAWLDGLFGAERFSDHAPLLMDYDV
jgi:exodeoxyribonuclease III